jgi:hypothetical protein
MGIRELIARLQALGGLRGIQRAQPGDAAFVEAAAGPERDFKQLIDMVRSAIVDVVYPNKLEPDRYVYVEAIYADRVIVEVQGRKYQYGYSINTVNQVDQVVFTGPTEVVEQYVAVKEALASAVADGSVVFVEAADGSIEVTIVRAGASGNANYYPDAALKDAVALFEGVRVFAKSDAEHLKGGGKDVRNLIGGIYGVKFVEGTAPDTGRLVGTFKALDQADPIVTKMTEAVKRGLQGLLGLSIDAFAKTKTRTQGGTRLREATKFTKVNSVDLIVEPGAGGGLDRLTEAAADQHPQLPGEKTMPLWKKRMLEAIKAKDAAKYAVINVDTIDDDELVNLHEAVCGSLVHQTEPAKKDEKRLTEGLQGNSNEDDAPVSRAEFQMLHTRNVAAAKISASKLPQIAKDKLAAQFNAAARFTEAEVDKAISDEAAYLGRFTESGSVRVPAFGTGAGGIEVGDRSVAMKDMLDAFFDPTHKEHRSVRSFKECYIEMTGDRNVTGQLSNVDIGRLRESLGESFRESLISSSWANALGDSMTRRMQAIYTGQTDLQAWRKVATTAPVNDFRTQERTRIGGYGNLPAVAQAGAYTALSSPGDAKATYAVTKRGGTEDVTLEMIMNDDVQAIRRIPIELALAAANTLYEFVFDFFRTNPTIHDAVALYHATHGNLFTAPLDATAFAAHRLAMLTRTRAGSGKRLATGPKSVLVPFELQETAYNLFVRNQNLDKTFVQSINPEVIPVAYWTDANDWCTVSDPMVLPVLEIGFLRGQEEPELFVQDMPNVGSMFSNDKTTYKIRHIYSGAVLVDGEKGTTKAVVP